MTQRISNYLVILGAIGILFSLLATFIKMDDEYIFSSLFLGFPIFVLGLLWNNYENKKYGREKNKYTLRYKKIIIWISVSVLAFYAAVILYLGMFAF